MNIDFFDAHQRHWQDAELLFKRLRLATADHLYGLSAECGLKRLMACFGMAVNQAGDPSQNRDKVHADRVWLQYESYRAGHSAGVLYSLPAENPFQDWSVNQRYAAQSDFLIPRVNNHRQGADFVRNLIERACREGLL